MLCCSIQTKRKGFLAQVCRPAVLQSEPHSLPRLCASYLPQSTSSRHFLVKGLGEVAQQTLHLCHTPQSASGISFPTDYPQPSRLPRFEAGERLLPTQTVFKIPNSPIRYDRHKPARAPLSARLESTHRP